MRRNEGDPGTIKCRPRIVLFDSSIFPKEPNTQNAGVPGSSGGILVHGRTRGAPWGTLKIEPADVSAGRSLGPTGGPG